MYGTGGKVIAFTCGRPTVGKGMLMRRDDRNSLGTSDEAKLRCPAFKGADSDIACENDNVTFVHVHSVSWSDI